VAAGNATAENALLINTEEIFKVPGRTFGISSLDENRLSRIAGEENARTRMKRLIQLMRII